jgi:hypothetical protein
MPMAPPRLRIRLNRPEAYRSSAPSKPVKAMVTLGTMHSISENPRISWGTSRAPKPQSGVMNELSHWLRANSVRPAAMVMRASSFCDRRAAIGTLASWAIPVTTTVMPICRLS